MIFDEIPPALWATSGFGLACQHLSLQLLHPILSVLEEGFSPPPPSPPGLKPVRSRGPVLTYIQLIRHPGHHHFFIFFQHHFILIFTWFWLPTWRKNPLKIDQKSIRILINFRYRFLIDFGSLLAPKLDPFFDTLGSKIALGRRSTSKTSISTE